MIPRATYRLQLHKDFTFADAAARANYLAELGISHVYTSPILMARAGSLHGYDVIDHGRINPELGGESGFIAMAEAFQARGLSLIVDIVPNHMAVGGADNGWWLDLLQHGQASRHAGTFDIDWDVPDLEGKVFVPFLDGSPEELIGKGELRLARDGASGLWQFAYYDHRFPLRSEDQQRDLSGASSQTLLDLLARQHFVLADWRLADSRINWRRFFDITALAAIRVGEPAVFEAVHDKIFALYEAGLIDGVRVDHIDGLADPAAYCRQLRQRLTALRPEPYIVVEKILADDEELDAAWQTDGTTGYDFMNEISALLHAEDGGALETLWATYGERGLSFEDEERRARREILATKFSAQLAATARAFARIVPKGDDIPAALTAIIAELRCYRSYATGASGSPGAGPHLSAALARAARFAPAQAATIARLGSLFERTDGDAAVMDALRRFHQLSAPVAAKAVEDTAFYRYGRLLSRNDVGFDPRRHTLNCADFHKRMTRRAQTAPAAMLATATHDHKRGEDTRARLAVLSAMPQDWADFVAGVEVPDQLHRGDVYFLLQTLVGAWPADADDAFADRIALWCEKYLREAKLRSNWADPDTAYEGRLKDYAHSLITGPGGGEFRSRPDRLLEKMAAAAANNSLVQTVLHYTLPGVPDLYQGCEFSDYSLVDPDNRRPVDYAVREKALGQHSNRKQDVISALLRARKINPDLWRFGTYEPLHLNDEGILAFTRRHEGSSLTVTVLRRPASTETLSVSIALPGPCRDILSGAQIGPGDVPAGEILAGRPAGILYAGN